MVEVKKRILIINIIFIALLVLFVFTGLFLITLILTGEVEVALILSGWLAFMNNFGLNFFKTLVLLIIPVFFIGVIKYSNLDRVQIYRVSKIVSFMAFIILGMYNLFNLIYYAYLGSTRQDEILLFMFLFDVFNLVLYIIIYVLIPKAGG